MNRISKLLFLFIFCFFLVLPSVSADVQRVYDQAGILSDEEVAALEKKAADLFKKWETDFIVITTESTEGLPIMKYMQNFTDQLAKEFNRKKDNMAVITLDMGDRWVDLAGFGRAETYLPDSRLDMIRGEITPSLSAGNYYEAFDLFFDFGDEYLDKHPNIFFNTFFQLALSLGLAGAIVFFMAYTSGGRVTVTSRTYLDESNTKIIDKHDIYLRKTVTRKRKPSSKSGGGGGGISGGGRSHSGSRGRF